MSKPIEHIKDSAGTPIALEQRVLVLDPTCKDAQICRAILGDAGIEAAVCMDWLHTHRELAAGAAVLLATEESLAPEQVGDLAAALARQPPWSDLPVLVLTQGGAESPLAAWAMDHLDNVMLLQRPVARLTLLSAVRALLKHRRRQYQLRDYLAERKRQQEVLQAREQRSRATFENAASGIAEVNAEDRLVSVNDRLCQMLGHTREELLGRSVEELTWPEDRPRSQELRDQLHDGRLSVFQHEKRYIRKDGSPLWAHVGGAAVRDEAGRYLYTVGTVVDISARKAAESQVRLQAAALEAAPNAISLSETDPKGTIVWVNPAFTKLTGYSLEEIVGRTHHLLSSGRQAQAFYRDLWQTIKRGEVWRGELVNRRKDGTIYHEEMGVTPLRDEDGHITHFVAIKQDVTARKQAEQACRQSEERFRALGTASSEALYQMSPDWREMRQLHSRGFLANTEEPSRTWLQGYIPPEDQLHVTAAIHEAIRTRSVFELEHRVRRADGTVGWAFSRAVPLLDAKGKITEWFGAASDITQRKQAEEALRQSERELRFVCESIPHLVWTAQPDGHIDYVNQRALDYTGARQEELVGWGWLPLVHPEDRQQTTWHWAAALREGRELKIQYRLRHGRSGEYRWHAAHALPLRDAQGRVIRWYGTCTDIEEQKQTEERLEQRVRQRTVDLAKALTEAEQGRATLDALLQSIPEGITIREAAGDKLRCASRYMAQMLGVDIKTLEGTTAEEYAKRWETFEADGITPVRPEDFPVVQAMREGTTVRERELVLRRENGAKVPILCNAAPIRDSNGRIIGGVGAWRDIAERKRAEETNARLAAIVESSEDAIIAKSLDGIIQSWNAGAERLFGYRAEEVIGKPITLLLPPDRQGEEGQILQRLRGGERVEHFETLRLAKDGRRIDVSVTVSPVKDRQGRMIGASKIARDITERKRAEAALQESEERLRAFLENSAVTAWIKDEDGRYIFMSRNFQKRRNVRLEEWKRKTDFELWPREVAEELRRNDQAALASSGSMEVLEHTTASDGSDAWWLAHKFAFRDSSGRRYVGGLAVDVTQRQRAEEALRESRQQVSADLDAMIRLQKLGALSLSETNLESLLTEVVDAAIAISGADFGNIQRLDPRTGDLTIAAQRGFSRPWLDFWNSVSKGKGACGTALEHGERIIVEDIERSPIFAGTPALQVQLRAGVRAVQSTPLVSRLGKPVGMFSTHFSKPHRPDDRVLRLLDLLGRQAADMIERAETEEALRESEERFRTLADAISQLVWVANADGWIHWYNRRWYEYTGTTEKDMEGWGWQSVHDPEVLPEVLERWKASITAGEPLEMEFPLRGADGQFRRFLTRAVPLKDAQGRVVQWFGTNTDVEELKRVQEALHQSEQRLRLAQQAARIGAFEWNIQTGVNVWMPELEAMYGLAPGTFGKTQPAWEQLVHLDDRAAALERIRQAFETSEPVEGEWRVVWPDGSIHWLMGRFQIFKDAEGKPLRLSGVNIDITERKRAEAALRQLNATLEQHADALAAAQRSAERAKAVAEQASAAKDHFLAVLSHELRTPLTPILPALTAMERLAPEEGREYLEIARRNVELEARLIDDLLDVTRIARGKVELNRMVVDLGTILHRAAEVCKADIEARRLHFGIKVEDGPHPVHVDPARLQQVFWNLIKNAVKFTPHGGCVGVRCWRENGRVMAEVTDSGEGIAPEALSRVFNAFEQESRSTTRQFGGLGLGLAISKALVEMHGGRIQVHSAGKGQGATFTVALPVAESGPMEKPAAEAEPPAPARELRILLVEDHGDTARMMGRLLGVEGHSVKHAGDVTTALELAGGEEFDVLISDLGLPDGSGHDLMRELRARGQRLPGIALSGYGTAEDVQRSREAGFQAHLTKPVNFGALLAAVCRVANGASIYGPERDDSPGEKRLN